MIANNNIRESKMLRCILHVVRQAMEVERPAVEAAVELPFSMQGASPVLPLRVERVPSVGCSSHGRARELAHSFMSSAREVTLGGKARDFFLPRKPSAEKLPLITRNRAFNPTDHYTCLKYASRCLESGGVRTYADDCSSLCLLAVELGQFV